MDRFTALVTMLSRCCARHLVPGSAEGYKLPVRDSASLVLVVEGAGKQLASRQLGGAGGLAVVEPYASAELAPGSVLFLAADRILEIFPENCEQMVLFQAYCNL